MNEEVRFLFLFVWLAFVGSFLALTVPASAQQNELDMRLSQPSDYTSGLSLCGPICVVYALRDRNIMLTVKEAAQLSGWEVDGTTWEGLQRALEQKGVRTLARMLYKPKDLAALNVPAILAMEDRGIRHYLYVRRTQNQNFLLMGFPGFPEWWSLEEVLEHFTGEILLIAPRNIYRINRSVWLSLSFLAGLALAFGVLRTARYLSSRGSV